MGARVEIFAMVVSVLLLLSVLELVRRRRLLERYALLWLFSALVLIGLALWRELLEVVAGLIGVAYAPSALFLIASGFILVLLLHFSIAVSRLADQSKVLAQRLALLEQRQHAVESAAALAEGEVPVDAEGHPVDGGNGRESRAAFERAARR